jgi:hypothetical protein
MHYTATCLVMELEDSLSSAAALKYFYDTRKTYVMLLSLLDVHLTCSRLVW